MRIFFTATLLFVFVCSMSAHDNLQKENATVTEFASCIGRDPNLITNYDINSIIKNADENELRILNDIIVHMNTNSVRRTLIKSHYLPFCLKIIEHWIENSKILQTISEGKQFNAEPFISENNSVDKRNINRLFQKYAYILGSISNTYMYETANPIIYGNIRFIEEMLYGKTSYIDAIDPIPQSLTSRIEKICDTNSDNNLDDLIRTIINHEQDFDFLISNSEIIIEYSTYTATPIEEFIVSIVAQAHVTNNRLEELMDLILITGKRRGDMYEEKCIPLLKYQFRDLMQTQDLTDNFIFYKDSLISKGVEFAKYLPHQCPKELQNHKDFKDYSKRFFKAIQYVFNILESNNDIPSQYFNIFACKNRNEFIILYTDEVLKRFYNHNDITSFKEIEEIYQLLINMYGEKPIRSILDIAGVYIDLNPKKSRDILRKCGIIEYIEKQIASETEISHENLYIASLLASTYASLHNDLRYPKINEYINYIEKNIDKLEPDHQIDDIIYEVASALTCMNEGERSIDWISKVNIKKSEYKEEFNHLLLENYYILEENKKILKTVPKIKELSIFDIARIMDTQVMENDHESYEKYLKLFNSELGFLFSEFLYMDTEDQDWFYSVCKYKIASTLYSSLLQLCLYDFIEHEVNADMRHFFATALYNWALASKGALLRSLKESEEIVRKRMSEEEFRHLKSLINMEIEDAYEINMENCINIYASEISKKIFLDYIRKKKIDIFTDFDYKDVRDKLKEGETAVEIVNIHDNNYIATLIKKEWEYPYFIDLNSNYIDDTYKCLWKPLETYLETGEKVYISLDGVFNTRDIEFCTDSADNVMADKYKIYRVSTTMNISKDLFIDDLSSSVLYGNLKYSDGLSMFRTAVNFKWIDIPHTKAEIDTISHILNSLGIKSKIYEGNKGDKASFFEHNGQDIDLIHMATHGFYWPIESHNGKDYPPMKRAGIVLAGSELEYYYNRNSGTLFANELSNMDLRNVKLMVLSACETGMGEEGKDGIMGLQRALKQAGVKTIIMSLKKVNSACTETLMSEFYKAFATGLSAREAFRKAQKITALKYHDDSWKSFIILD